MTDRLTILGCSWVDGLPFVRVIEADSSNSELRPLLGLHLGYRTEPEAVRTCLGHRPFRGDRTYVDCRQRPLPGKRVCRSCAIVEATFASNLHHAHTKDDVGLDPAIAAHLRQPNLLYLAAFRDGSVKVGTSTENRHRTRLAEQGAWMAQVVAWASDGITVRLLEDWVTDRLGLAQAISSNRKLEGFERPRTDEDLQHLLDTHREQVHRLMTLDRDPDLLRPLERSWRHPRADTERWSSLHRYPADLRSGSHDLDVIDACGRMILLRRPGGPDRFVADLQQLYGRELEFGAFGSEPLTVQDSLF